MIDITRIQRLCMLWMAWCSYLPSTVGQQEQAQGYGGTGHGMGRGHAVLRVVEHLHLYHRGRGRSRPPDHIFRALAEIHDPYPDHDEPAAHISVYVPHEEREEWNVEKLVPKLGTEREQVE